MNADEEAELVVKALYEAGDAVWGDQDVKSGCRRVRRLICGCVELLREHLSERGRSMLALVGECLRPDMAKDEAQKLEGELAFLRQGGWEAEVRPLKFQEADYIAWCALSAILPPYESDLRSVLEQLEALAEALDGLISTGRVRMTFEQVRPYVDECMSRG